MRCEATTAAGRPCRCAAVRGERFCHAHSGAEVGRPCGFSEEVAARIVAAVAAGCYYEVAARAAGVSSSTFYRWCERGREEEAGQLCDFVAELERAKAGAEVRLVANIARAAADEWRAGAWLLARRSPDRWGRSSSEPDPAASPPGEPESLTERDTERQSGLRELPQELLDRLEGHYGQGD